MSTIADSSNRASKISSSLKKAGGTQTNIKATKNTKTAEEPDRSENDPKERKILNENSPWWNYAAVFIIAGKK